MTSPLICAFCVATFAHLIASQPVNEIHKRKMNASEEINKNNQYKTAPSVGVPNRINEEFDKNATQINSLEPDKIIHSDLETVLPSGNIVRTTQIAKKPYRNGQRRVRRHIFTTKCPSNKIAIGSECFTCKEINYEDDRCT